MGGTFYSYWGKIDHDPFSHDPNQPIKMHLLPYHCLDVAACADQYLRQVPTILQGIAAHWGCQASDLPVLHDLLVRLAAFHDLGKFDPHFTFMYPKIQRQIESYGLTAASNEVGCYNAKKDHHSVMGYRLWTEQETRNPLLQGTRWDVAGEPASNKVACFLAHHGMPPTKAGNLALGRANAKGHFKNSLQHVQDFILAVDALFGDQYAEEHGRLLQMQPVDAGLLFAVLNDFITKVDWQGSETEYFPFVEKVLDLKEYWQNHALPQAARSIGESGLARNVSVRKQPVRFDALFPHIQKLTDLQRVAWEDITPKGSSLYIFEDVMGAGKTEAALLLAYRCLQASLASGVYFALPTRATSDGVYRRLLGSLTAQDIAQSPYLQNLFDGSPEVILAHSGAKLSRWRESLECLQDAQGENTATGNKLSWYMRKSKASLGADFGVGTVDQALMSILKVKHWTLRQAALSNKVLILDEVHSYDAYTFALICALVRRQTASGLPVIVLTATLAEDDRKQLLKAAYEGKSDFEKKHSGMPGPNRISTSEIQLSDAFPAVTVFDDVAQIRKPHLIEVACPARNQRKVYFEYVSDDWGNSVETAIRNALGAGQCVCILRNTVRQAQEAYEKWAGIAKCLVHSGFTPNDRRNKETDVDTVAGKKSTAQTRAGSLVISTQVLEQSLDLDFDLMVTDLAPIDSLLQRSGRVWRHLRDAFGNPAAVEGRSGKPTLMIVGPPLSAEDKDWKALLGPSANIYHLCDLWRTAHTVSEKGVVHIPQDMRSMLAAVYNAPPKGTLSGKVLESWNSHREQEKKQAFLAGFKDNLKHTFCNLDEKVQEWNTTRKELSACAEAEEELLGAQTRIGIPSWNLKLIVRDKNGLRPWAGDLPIYDSAKPDAFRQKTALLWEDSGLSTYCYNITGMDETEELTLVGEDALGRKGAQENDPLLLDLKRTMPDKGKFSLLVVGYLDAKGTFEAYVPHKVAGGLQMRRLRYNAQLGLHYKG